MDEQDQIIRAPIPDELLKDGIATLAIDDREIVVVSEEGGYRAIDRWCPHEDGDLGEGLMFGKHIKCPIHGYIFELTKGQCLNQLNIRARVYAVEVDQEEIVLRPLS